MEYEQFYKFLENRPVQELNDCVHRIVNMIGSRFTEQKAPTVSQNHVSIGFGTQLGTETVRAESIKKLIVRDGYLLPHGMSGYHKSDLRFIRWFPGYHGPVPNPNTFSLEHKLPTDWFLDKELQVWLNWNPDGYFEMSRKDSLKFNQNNPLNKNLVEEARCINSSNAEKRKAESVTGSVDRKRSRSSDLPAPAAVTTSQPAPRFKYLSSTSESENNSENEADGHMNTEPMETDKPDSEMTPEDVEKELVRQNSTVSSTTAVPTTPPPTPTVPSKPIKGDTVFITGGKYANSEGTVMGGNEKAYRVQIPNLVDPGSIIAQVPIEMVTLVRPTASCSASNNTDSSESYLSALKRISDRPKPKPLSQLSAAPTSSAAASTVSAAPVVIENNNNNKQPKANAHGKMHVDQDDKDSVDEFFSYLASSDKDYFSSDKSAPVVGENSTVITAKNKASSHSTAPRTTATSTANNVPTVSQSSEMSADSLAPRNGGASEGSFPTESLTTPPDMVRDAETVSSMGLSLEMEIERETGGTLETYVAPAPAVPIHTDAETKVAAPAHCSLQALVPAPTLSTASSAASTPTVKKPKRVGRPKKNKEGGYSKPWSFKCKCGEVCSSYENASYHPVGQWYECSQCTVWSHVECMLGSVTITQVQEMEEVLCFSCKSKARRNRKNRDQSVDKRGEVDPTSAPVQTTTTDGVKAVAKVQPSLRAESATPVPAATTTTPTTSTDTFVKVVVETVQSKPSTVAAAPSPEPVASAEKSPAEAVVTLPVKITTAVKPIVTHLSDSASEKAKEAKEAKPRSHKRKAHTTSAFSSAASSRLLHVGQRVTLLRGQHRNEEAEVIDVARAGPVVLPDVYKVKLCAGDDKDKILQMPLEFLTKKLNSEQSGDSKVVQSEMSAESSTEDHQHRSTSGSAMGSVQPATVPFVDPDTPANPVAPTPVIVPTPEPAPEPAPVLEAPAQPASAPALAPAVESLSAPAPVAESAPDQSPQSSSALTTVPAAPAPPPSEIQPLEVNHSLSHTNLSDMSPEEVREALMEVEQDEKLNDAPVAGEDCSAASAAGAAADTDDANAIAVDASAPLPPAEQTDTTVVHLPEKEPSVHPLLRWQPQGQAYDNVAK